MTKIYTIPLLKTFFPRQARPAETPLDVYGSAVAPVGTSAPGMEITFLGILTAFSPVPDDAFTNNDVLTSYDSYDTPVIDLTNSEDLDNSIDDVVVLKDASEAQGKLVSNNAVRFRGLTRFSLA